MKKYRNTNKTYVLFLLLITVMLVSACTNNNNYEMVKVIESGGAKVSDSALVTVLAKEKQMALKLSYSSNVEQTIQQVINKEIDLAIIPNNSELLPGSESLRTVAKLLPRAMMIFYKSEHKPSLSELFDGSRVSYELTGVSDSTFYKNFLAHYNIDPHKFQHSVFNGSVPFPEIKAQLDSADIWISISHIHNYLVDSLFAYGFELYPLDEHYVGNSIDGFAMKYPQASPMLIPKFLFDGKPSSRIATLSVSDILVTHKDFSTDDAYGIIEVLTEERNLFLQHDKTYNLLPITPNETFRLLFPLHRGTLDYINREKPSFFERYAELLALILSFTVISTSVLIPLIRNMKQPLQRSSVKADLDTVYDNSGKELTETDK